MDVVPFLFHMYGMTHRYVLTSKHISTIEANSENSPSLWEMIILGSGTPSCQVLALIFAILWGANTSIDTTDKARGREGGKQLSTDNIYLDDHLEVRNLTISPCICKL